VPLPCSVGDWGLPWGEDSLNLKGVTWLLPSSLRSSLKRDLNLSGISLCIPYDFFVFVFHFAVLRFELRSCACYTSTLPTWTTLLVLWLFGVFVCVCVFQIGSHTNFALAHPDMIFLSPPRVAGITDMYHHIRPTFCWIVCSAAKATWFI
jgi:hypothetical protein